VELSTAVEDRLDWIAIESPQLGRHCTQAQSRPNVGGASRPAATLHLRALAHFVEQEREPESASGTAVRGDAKDIRRKAGIDPLEHRFVVAKVKNEFAYRADGHAATPIRPIKRFGRCHR
jgi:hypothetical protein